MNLIQDMDSAVEVLQQSKALIVENTLEATLKWFRLKIENVYLPKLFIFSSEMITRAVEQLEPLLPEGFSFLKRQGRYDMRSYDSGEVAIFVHYKGAPLSSVINILLNDSTMEVPNLAQSWQKLRSGYMSESRKEEIASLERAIHGLPNLLFALANVGFTYKPLG